MSSDTGVICPLECVKSGCPSDPDWLEKHSTFVLTFSGILGAGLTVVLTYFLKSRCKKIKCCGLECDRTPVELTPDQIELQTQN